MEKIINNPQKADTKTKVSSQKRPKSSPRGKKTGYRQLSTALTYLSVTALIISLVSVGYQSPIEQRTGQGVAATAIEADAPSVDQVVAANLAATTAEVANLSVASNVSNLSISLNAKGELAQNNDNVMSKPQIIEADYGGILTSYKVRSGDTVPSLARHFGISSQTIKWANDLTSDALESGRTLLIPSTDGVVYTAQSGDTLESIARKFKADKSRIVTFNNLELSGIKAGKRLVVPGGILPENERPSAATATSGYSGYASESSGGGGVALSVGNRYDYGYCTWYVYNRRAALGRPIGSFWGNATTWASYAASSGYTVNNRPAVGSVLQDPYSAGGYGHVAVVESIHSDGSITISEMNYAGWNVQSSRTISAGEAAGYSYIH